MKIVSLYVLFRVLFKFIIFVLVGYVKSFLLFLLYNVVYFEIFFIEDKFFKEKYFICGVLFVIYKFYFCFIVKDKIVNEVVKN